MNNLSYNHFEHQAQVKKQLIDQHLNEGFNEIYKRVLWVSDAFYSNLVANVTGWITNASCRNGVDNLFKVRSQTKAFTAELVNVVSDKVKEETQAWVQNRFVPLLRSEIQTLAETVDVKANSYLDELDSLRVTLDVNQDEIVRRTTPSAANRVFSSGASLLIGDLGGAIMGGAGGFDATLKTIGCEFGAGFILGIVSLFTPVGLTAFIVGVVISAIVGGAWSLSSIEKNIRRKMSEEIIKNLKSSAQKEKFNNMITSNVMKSLDELRKNVNAQWDEFLGAESYEKAS